LLSSTDNPRLPTQKSAEAVDLSASEILPLEKQQGNCSAASDVVWETDADLRMVSRRNIDDREIRDEWTNSGQDLIGKTALEMIGADPANAHALAAHWADLLARKPFRGFVHRTVKPDGSIVWLEANGDPMFSQDGAFLGYRGITRDITHRRADDPQIAFLAAHDPLTGLPNRELFLRVLEQALAELRPGTFLAVLILDLDNFRVINEAMGHSVGDDLLRAVSQRLSACIRHRDTVARVDGDEFAIVQVDLERPDEAAAFAERISQTIYEPYQIRGHFLMPTATMGIAVAPGNGVDAAQLLRNADIAQRSAKHSLNRECRGGWRFYEPEMGARVEERNTLETELRHALVRGELELYYQPFYNVATRNACAFEALLRWHHPTRGMVLPDQFISMAEETGLIVPIGEWILLEACREAMKWPSHISVSVNLSPVQFRSGSLVDSVKNALRESGLQGSRLELEITESVLMQDSDVSFAALHRLRALGCRISMDDFGTGYSSLSYLRRFPFDKIKIDRSFIQDLNRYGGTEIIHAIATLGASLRLATTAEGVETKEQFSIVRAEGCTEVQGYLFSEPRPAKDLPALLHPFPEDSFFWLPDCPPPGVAPPSMAPPDPAAESLLVDVPGDSDVFRGEAI